MEYDEALPRFLAQFENFRTTYPTIKLYALVDRMLDATLCPVLQQYYSGPQHPLYADTGLDGLEQQGPLLIACPSPETASFSTVLHMLWRAVQKDYRTVSWLWTTHDIVPLTEHLQTLLHANLESDGKDAWFFFHQPNHLPVLHRELKEDAHDYLFGSCAAWWCLDRHGKLIELDGSMQAIPAPWPVFPVTLNVIEQLQRQGLPQQIHGWLKCTIPDVLGKGTISQQLQQLAPFIDKAHTYGITDKRNLSMYVAVGLQYDAHYDEHPALQHILQHFRHSKTPLIDGYSQLDATVWQEVREGPQRRQQQAVIAAYQEQVRQQGYEQLETTVVNETAHAIKELRIALPGKHYRLLGDFKDKGIFANREFKAGKTAIAAPGKQVLVCWRDETGAAVERTVTVGGKLPLTQSDGIAIVRYRADREIKVSMREAKSWWRDRGVWE